MSRDIEIIKGLPKRIYLVIDDDEELEITEIAIVNEVQWCEDDIYNEGLEYVRIDEVRKLQAANAELKGALQYYFDVLREVRGPNWADKPDHVMQKFLNAMKTKDNE